MSKNFISAAVFATAIAAAASANAADMRNRPAPVPTYPQAIADYGFSWTGAYVGAYAGARMLRADATDSVTSGNNGKVNSTGFDGGLQLGYNMQSGAFVYGLETDLGYGGNSKTASYGTATYKVKQGFEGTTRARLGYAFDRALVYGTAGVAYSDFETTFTKAATSTKKSDWRFGWTAGAGVEYAVAKNVTVKGEYLYTDFGTATAGDGKVDLADHTVRVGVNYKF